MMNTRPKTIEGIKLKLDMMSVDTPSGCREFTGAKSPKGYGKISFKDKHFRAHRLAYILKFGDISEGLIVCHKCDNPSCVNTEHLFLGTPKDNAIDRMLKGRGNNQYTKQGKGVFMTGYDIFVIILVLGLMFGNSGCSTSIIVKDCEPTSSSSKQICKTLKPWE